MAALRKCPPANRPPPDSSQSNWWRCEGVASSALPVWPACCRWLWSQLARRARWPAALPSNATWTHLCRRRRTMHHWWYWSYYWRALRIASRCCCWWFASAIVRKRCLPWHGEFRLGRPMLSIAMVLETWPRVLWSDGWRWWWSRWHAWLMRMVAHRSDERLIGGRTVRCSRCWRTTSRPARMGNEGVRWIWKHRASRP